MSEHWTAHLAGEARFAVRVEMPTTADAAPSVVLRLRATANPADVHIRIPARRTLALFVRMVRALDAVPLQPDVLAEEATDIVRAAKELAESLAGYERAETAQDQAETTPFATTLDDVQVRIALDLSSGAEITVAVSFWDACEMLRALSLAVVAVLRWLLERVGTGETDSGEETQC